jgi:sortase A
MSLTLDRPKRLRGLLPQHRANAAPKDAPPRKPAPPLPPATVASLWVLLTISLLAGWFVLYATVLSGLQQQRDNSVLYKDFRQNLSTATVPIGQPIAPSTPVALLKLPAAGLPDEVVVEGTTPSDLAKGVGHLRTSALPGQPGVSVLYGRSVTYGGPFGDLEHLVKGTKFAITTGQGTFSYVVDAVRRVGDPLPSRLAPNGSWVTLETSTGSLFAPSQPLYIDATLQGKTVPAATAPLSAVPKSEQAFGTDRSHLAQLIFWLQGLLVVVLLTVWAATRWGRWQAWLIGTPLVIATLWGVTGYAMTLLPNLV